MIAVGILKCLDSIDSRVSKGFHAKLEFPLPADGKLDVADCLFRMQPALTII